MAEWKGALAVLGVVSLATSSYAVGFTGDPSTDGWEFVGWSLDSAYVADWDTGPFNFDAYSYVGSWTGTETWTQTPGYGNSTPVGWLNGDLVFGLGFVAYENSFDVTPGETRSAYFKFDFAGTGPWRPVGEGYDSDTPPSDRTYSKFGPVNNTTPSYISGGFQGYMHQQNDFVALKQNYSDLAKNLTWMGNVQGPEVRGLITGVVDDPDTQWELVWTGEYLLNYSYLKRSGLPLADVNPEKMKAVLGVYGPDGGQDVVFQMYPDGNGGQSVPAVPEPATLGLAAIGLALAAKRRRKN